MDDFYLEETSKKEIVFKVFITLIIVACAVLLGMYLIGKNSLHINKEITVEVGDTLSKKVSDYVLGKIKNTTEYKIKVEKLKLGEKVEKTGEYKYTVKYNNHIKEGVIKVVDTKPPVVSVQDLTVGLNEDYDLDDFVTSCEDYSKPCTIQFKDDKEYTSVGTYDVTLVISDTFNNKTEKKAKLTIKDGYSLKSVKESDTSIVSMEPNVDDFKDEYIFKKFDKASMPDDEESIAEEYLYEIINDDMSKYIPSEYSGSSIINQETIELFNKYGYIVGYAFKVKLSNGEETYLKNNQEN